MNLEAECDSRIAACNGVVKDANATIARIKVCRSATQKFLAKCASLGIKKVAIGRSDKSVPASVGWSFSPIGSVFSDDVRDEGGWPAIWRAVQSEGLSGGCGNSNQHQLSYDHPLVEGVYHFKAGAWQRVSK